MSSETEGFDFFFLGEVEKFSLVLDSQKVQVRRSLRDLCIQLSYRRDRWLVITYFFLFPQAIWPTTVLLTKAVVKNELFRVVGDASVFKPLYQVCSDLARFSLEPWNANPGTDSESALAAG